MGATTRKKSVGVVSEVVLILTILTLSSHVLAAETLKGKIDAVTARCADQSEDGKALAATTYAEDLRRSKDYEAAAAVFSETTSRWAAAPSRGKALAGLAMAKIALGKMDEAAQAVEDLRESATSTAGKMAEIKRIASKYEECYAITEAGNLWSCMLSQSPSPDQAISARTGLLVNAIRGRQKTDVDAAMKDLLAQFPDGKITSPDTLFRIGRAYNRAGQCNETAKYYLQLVDGWPNYKRSGVAYKFLVGYCQSKGNIAGADSAVQKALAGFPADEHTGEAVFMAVRGFGLRNDLGLAHNVLAVARTSLQGEGRRGWLALSEATFAVVKTEPVDMDRLVANLMNDYAGDEERVATMVCRIGDVYRGMVASGGTKARVEETGAKGIAAYQVVIDKWPRSAVYTHALEGSATCAHLSKDYGRAIAFRQRILDEGLARSPWTTFLAILISCEHAVSGDQMPPDTAAEIARSTYESVKQKYPGAKCPVHVDLAYSRVIRNGVAKQGENK